MASTDRLLVAMASRRFALCSLSELWILYSFDLFLAHALRLLREEPLALGDNLTSRSILSFPRVNFAWDRVVVTAEAAEAEELC